MDPWQLLIQNIANKGVQLEADEIDVIQSAFHHRKYRKSQYILQQGDVARHESFIIKGLARKYYVDDRGQEHILLFAAEEWWAGDLDSLYTGRPTDYNIDCLEETEVLQITRNDLEQLYVQLPKINIYFRILFQNSIMAYNKRVTSALSKTALERYQEFIERYPRIEQRIPNHQIASFLGITPQSLSRIRKQFTEKA